MSRSEGAAANRSVGSGRSSSGGVGPKVGDVSVSECPAVKQPREVVVVQAEEPALGPGDLGEDRVPPQLVAGQWLGLKVGDATALRRFLLRTGQQVLQRPPGGDVLV